MTGKKWAGLASLTLLLVTTIPQGMAQPLPAGSEPEFEDFPGPGPDPTKQPFVDPLAPEPPDLLKPDSGKPPGRKDATPPPKPLKETNALPPVRDIQSDISQTTQAKLREIRAVRTRMRDSTQPKDAQKIDQQTYDRLYRELHEERRAAIHSGIRETDPAVKKAYSDRARAITDTLAKLPPLRRSMRMAGDGYYESQDRREKRDARYQRKRDRELLGYWDLRYEAQKTINTSDKAGVYDMLRRMKQDYNERQNASGYKAQPDMKDYREYITDYERALQHKWPSEPGPGSIVPSPYKADGYPGSSQAIPGYIDPMRRHGFGDTMVPQGQGAYVPDTFQADSLRNRRHIEQGKAYPPAGREQLEAPKIGKLPEIKDVPQAPDIIDIPVNRPGN